MMAKRHSLLFKFGKWVFRDFERMSSEKKKEKKPKDLKQRPVYLTFLYLFSLSNHMFGRAIWDKLPVFIFEKLDCEKFDT